MIHAPIASPRKSPLKARPQRGRLPVLQYCAPHELRIDPAYQRDISGGASQALIRRIATHWDWDLCQPLIVSRRKGLFSEERLFVVDGQHRLEGARWRGDIAQLPCVVTSYADADQEAAHFVALNQSRKPLSALDLFKAQVASGDEAATRLHGLITGAGLSLACHTNTATWKPGQICNIAGLTRALGTYGDTPVAAALQLLAIAWPDQALRKSGTIWPGLVHIVATCLSGMTVPQTLDAWHASPWPDLMREMLGGGSQDEWVDDIAAMKAIPGMEASNWRVCSERALAQAWGEFMDALEGND